MRIHLAPIALALAACGGAGGTDPAPDPAPGAPSPALQQAQQTLEDCALAHLPGLSDLLEIYGPALADPYSLDPQFQVTAIDFQTMSIGWSVDIEPDGTPDAVGVARFEDAQGNPTIPFSLEDILAVAAGTTDLFDLFPEIPDGTHLVSTFTWLAVLGAGGEIDAVWAGGLPGSVSGYAIVSGEGCPVTFTFTDVSYDDLTTGEYPALVLDLFVDADEGRLQGTVTLDGTRYALVEVTVPGEGDLRLLVDLLTGEVTEA